MQRHLLGHRQSCPQVEQQVGLRQAGGLQRVARMAVRWGLPLPLEVL